MPSANYQCCILTGNRMERGRSLRGSLDVGEAVHGKSGSGCQHDRESDEIRGAHPGKGVELDPFSSPGLERIFLQGLVDVVLDLFGFLRRPAKRRGRG